MNELRQFVVVAVIGAVSFAVTGAQDQDQAQGEELTIEVEPTLLTLEVGDKATLSATVRNAAGAAVDDATVVYYSRARRNVGVTRAGEVEAYRPGEFTLVALVPEDPDDDASARTAARVRVEIPVTVPLPPIDRVTFTDVPPKFYVGTHPRLSAEVVDTLGTVRHDVTVEYASGDHAGAGVDRFGYLTLHRPGSVDITVRAEEATDTISLDVETNPVTSLELQASAETARTGDVIRFSAIAKDARGLAVRGVPVQFAVGGETVPTIIAAGAAAHITDEGRFVAERSGSYVIVATAGSHTVTKTVAIERRDVRREVEVVGRGAVRDRRTADLWIWEGTDGRDYAMHGTWSADGHAYIWDVTDPTNPTKIREIQVDARTVNDIKVSEDGDVAVISREGASNRRNGLVILGVGNPREGVPVLSEFSDQLTGGVHNIFIAEDHVFALSAGRRYDIINIKDPRNPQRVGRFELDTPGHGIHDVWVSDGVAFSSNWGDGIVAVDIGGGGRGGTPERPVELGRYAYPSGWNHSAFPYKSKSTGKFYLFAGDEAFPYRHRPISGDPNTAPPARAAGWIHIIEWDDWENPREIARYQVPEAGTHNIWIEDDVLYIGYYNGGLRVVDVSGELVGDLYKQGREIAMFLPFDPEGYIPNAPMVWGPQLYKGNIFFTDLNSGLWIVRLLPKTGPSQIIGEPQ